ncbi:hypothetical protein L6279_04465 [Candidatus Parcubacteria bacterium]|nr:hypothetical protein [Patescibacteria group bacterium]MCG2693323.1 hypothetical protein [Candidatus Parcubacteria bacterium]
MTLFFLILLTVSLTVFGFQKLKKKTKLTIRPSLPEIEETQIPEQILPATSIPQTPQSALEPIKKPEWPSEPISLPPEQEPIMLSPKEPEPPGNLPVE